MGKLSLRPATLDDAAFAADVHTAVRPSSPADPVLLRHYWAHSGANVVAERFIAERAGRAVGFAWFDHGRWELVPERVGNIGGELQPAERTPERLEALIAAMENRAREGGARILRGRANEDDPTYAEVLVARGYSEDRRSRRWELDLVAERERIERMTQDSRARMRDEAVRILTLAEETDPKKYERIWRMSEEAADDVPTTYARTPETLADFMDWFRSPDICADRFWIAKEGDEIVGVSVLGYPPVRGVVGTHWTATARVVRGRGIARALKCETVTQAAALGVTRVRTGNDAANAPILHINEVMGYRRIPGAIHFSKQA